MMKRFGAQLTALLLALALLTVSGLCAPLGGAAQADKAAAKQFGARSGKLLAQQDIVPAGTSAADWLAIALALSGVEEDYNAYRTALAENVSARYAESGGLDAVRATEYHRVALTVLALGGDPTAFGQDADGTPIDLIADGTYSYAGELGKQGLNGWIFALIALDASGAAVPADAAYSREDMVSAIVSAQNEDGGFGLLSGGKSDVDLTAMALQALAPYEDQYGETVARALDYLAGQLTEDCGFVGYDEENLESTAQVVLALCALGRDPAKEAQFCRDGKTLLTGMDRFRMDDGLYRHALTDQTGDMMATEQALLAGAALERLRTGGPSIYDFTGYKAPPQSGGSPWPWAAGAAAALLGAAAIWIFLRKRKHHAEKNG